MSSKTPFCEFCGRTIERGDKVKYGKLLWLLGDFTGSRPRKGTFVSHNLHLKCYVDYARPLLVAKVFKYSEPIMDEEDDKEPEKPTQKEYISIKEILKCPSCGGELIKEEGCKRCKDCDWSACS
jgi:hypothetical protein